MSDVLTQEEIDRIENLGEIEKKRLPVTSIREGGDAGSAAGIDASFEKTVGTVAAGEGPDKEAFSEVKTKRETLAKEQDVEKKQLSKETKKVAVGAEEKRKQDVTQVIKQLKTEQDLDSAQVEYLQNKILTNLKMKELVDPSANPMVDFDTRKDAVNKKLDEAYQQGLATMKGGQPQLPELESTDVNANQAAITLALQSMTGIMGAISGRQVGYRASAAAASVGAEEMMANVQRRQKANAGLMNAYNKAVDKNAGNTQKFVTEYMKQIGQNGRKELEEWVKHRDNVEDVAIQKRKATLEKNKTKIDRLKLRKSISDAKYTTAKDALDSEQANITVYEKNKAIHNRTDVMAQKANQSAAISRIRLNQKDLAKKGIKLPLGTGRVAFMSETASVMQSVNDITATTQGRNAWNDASSSLRNLKFNLRPLDVKYSVQALKEDKLKMFEAIDL